MKKDRSLNINFIYKQPWERHATLSPGKKGAKTLAVRQGFSFFWAVIGVLVYQCISVS